MSTGTMKTKIGLRNIAGTDINPATEGKQDDVISVLENLVAFEIPAYDSILISYLTAGNGTGEIGTVYYYDEGELVCYLTLLYDSSNRLYKVIKDATIMSYEKNINVSAVLTPSINVSTS